MKLYGLYIFNVLVHKSVLIINWTNSGANNFAHSVKFINYTNCKNMYKKRKKCNRINTFLYMSIMYDREFSCTKFIIWISKLKYYIL